MDQAPSEIVYYPLIPIEGAPLWGPPTSVTIAIRTQTSDPLSLAPAARRVVTSLDREVPVSNIQTMETVVASSRAKTTFAMLLLAVAGGMALVLSAVGIYGVISYTVNQRRSEIGVRMALGAPPAQVGRMVVMQSLRVAAVGIAIGLGAAVATTRVLQSLLFNVSPTDPTTLGGVAVTLALLGALTTRNQLTFAQAEAELHSLLTHSLLTLEQQAVPGGELPVSASLPAAVSYTRQSPQLARLVISSGTGQLALEVLVQLEGSRLRVIRHG